MSRLTVQVDGMTCDHCNAAIEHAVAGIEGVRGVSADYGRGLVEVTFAEQPDEAAVREAIEDEGYDIVEVTGSAE